MSVSPPSVTIITICFNCLEDLKKTVESVSNIRYEGVEYLVIDGGSTDGTVDFLRKAAGIDKYVSESDGGIYDAMNKGVKLSNGEFVCFMNAGDVFNETLVPPSAFDFLSSSFDVIYGNCRRVRDGKTIGIYKNRKVGSILWDMPFSHQASFSKRSLLLKFPFDLNHSIAADYDFFLKLYVNKYKFRYVDVDIALTDNEGVSNTNKVRSILDRYKAYKSNCEGINIKVEILYGYLLARSFVSDCVRKAKVR